MRTAAGALILASLVFALTPREGGGESMANRYAFWVAPSIQEWANSVMVAPDRGEVEVFVADEGREFGLYESDLPGEHYDRVAAAIEAPGEPVGPDGPVLPGTPFGSLAIMDGENPVLLHTYVQESPRLADAFAAFSQVRDLIRQSPKHVVRVDGAWSPAEIGRGDDLGLTLTLTNVGSDPIKLRNPASAGMALTLLREGEGGMREFLREEALEERHFRLAANAGGKPAKSLGQVVSLAPGEALVIEVQKQVRLGPGSYPAMLRYESVPPKRPGRGFVSGNVQFDLGPLRVGRPG